MMHTEEARALREKIETRVGIKIADLRFYTMGQNANLYLVDLDDRRRILAKNLRAGPDTANRVDLEIEGWMLHYLGRKSKLPIPKVQWYDKTTILMDFIEDSGVMNDDVQVDAARALAAMHSVTSEFFGLERDTSVASFTQPNHFESNWAGFFAEYRLLQMAQACHAEKFIEADMMGRIERLAAKLPQYIGNTSIPGLVHGDLWGGNLLLGKGKINAFLDPAIYFADPEVELASIAALGTFGDAFFQAYNEIRPIAPEFSEIRCDLYALYPLLIQVRLGHKEHIERINTIVNRFTG
jgi:fructosamine-3-kinase